LNRNRERMVLDCSPCEGCHCTLVRSNKLRGENR
jgi:hypothetical protein